MLKKIGLVGFIFHEFAIITKATSPIKVKGRPFVNIWNSKRWARIRIEA